MRLTLSRAAVAVLLTVFCGRLKAAAPPPTPESYFGHRMGADRTVLDWKKVVDYYRLLASSTDRMRFLEYGKSSEGRPMIAGIFSTPETLRRLEHYRQIQKKLIDARATSPQEAERLVGEGKTVVLITCSIHATEIASTATAVEFAWKLATSTDPHIRHILDRTIVLLAPSINPDGLDLVSAWYRKTLNTPYEGTSPPELYHKYVGHDNNRDWYIFSQSETRAVVDQLHNAWHPQIVYDVHQMGMTGARIFFPPYLDPVEPNVDPVIAQEANMVGMAMAADLTASGRKGVVVNGLYDLWTPARHYQSFHGGMRILSESASVRIASPVTLSADQISNQALGYNPRERSWNLLEPWLGGEWHLRDIVDDQLLSMESLLTTAADRREFLLRNFYGFSRRQVQRESPAAFIISKQQDDPGAARQLLETLQSGAVEIRRATAAFTSDGRQYPEGTYVILMQQPFGGYAKALLERQNYPDLRMYPGGPPRRPYDVTAHTLPLLMGVKVDTAKDRFQSQLEEARSFNFTGKETGAPSVLSASDSESWIKVNAAWNSNQPVARQTESGDFVLGAKRPEDTVLVRPRLALYKSFMPSMDEGWTRWMLERFGWKYESLGNAAIRAGHLHDHYDVILFPDQSAASIEHGYRKGSMPDEFIGGLGEPGAAALKEFVKQGGRVIFLNDSVEYALSNFGLKVKNVLAGVPSREFYCPGSLLNVSLKPGSPLGYGLPESFTLWMEGSPVFDTAGDSSTKEVLSYSASPVLASGWLLGEKLIAGKPALVDVSMGQGHILLFGMRPQYRAQSYLTLKLLFNSFVMK